VLVLVACGGSGADVAVSTTTTTASAASTSTSSAGPSSTIVLPVAAVAVRLEDRTGTEPGFADAVRATLTDLRLFHRDQLIATHPLLDGRGARHLDPSHRPRRVLRPSTALEVTAGSLLELVGGSAAVAAVDVERRALSVYEQVLQ